MNRTCWQCPNLAANPKDAPIAICDECFSKLQESIKRATESRESEPVLVSYKEYKKYKK